MNDFRSRAADRWYAIGLPPAKAVLIQLNEAVAGFCGVFGYVRIRKKERSVTVRQLDRNSGVPSGPARAVLREYRIPFGCRLALFDFDLTLRKYWLRRRKACKQHKNDVSKK